jgi:hypothetical protein
MTKTPITELDFFAIKEQFKNYLKSQTTFKDYNFEGSNMSILLDILAYNTFQNNFYTNMAISEMFLDTAQLKNSIVSHAKELNYLPKSSTSAKATVRVSFTDVNGASTVTIPKGTRFTSTVGGNSFNFVTAQVYLARKTAISSDTLSATYVADQVDIYEGEIFTNFETEGYFVEDTAFKCVLSSENVDITSVAVSLDDGTIEYSYRSDIFGVKSTDRVFYIEPYFNDRYAVVFGRNIFGEQPDPNEKIQIEYRICNEDEPNGASRFATSFKPGARVETIQAATGGAKKETLESIRFFAPRSIQIQERAVTARDYEILLKQKYNEIQAVSVYGGEDLEPPQFGKVAVSVVLEGTNDLSESRKNEYRQYLADKTPLTIESIFVNPEFMFVDAIVNIYYSAKQTNRSQSDLENLVRKAFSDYSSVNLNAFGSTLRASKLMAAIDDIDDAILSNSLDLRAIIEYSPPLLLPQNPTFKFGSVLVKPYPFINSSGFTDFKPSISSSVFSYNNICALLQDNGSGIIQIITSDTINTRVLVANAGTVDYSTGIVRLVNFTTDGYAGRAIKIFGRKKEADIIAPKNRLLQLRDEDIKVIFNEVSL